MKLWFIEHTWLKIFDLGGKKNPGNGVSLFT